MAIACIECNENTENGPLFKITAALTPVKISPVSQTGSIVTSAAKVKPRF